MPPTDDAPAVSASLAAALARLDAPKALELSEDERKEIRQAIERVRAQWTGGPEPSLTIALAGGSGVGKSTLINALAHDSIAAAGEIRPTTMEIRVYHHESLPGGNLPIELVRGGRFVAHDRAELRLKVLVDTPDLDSLARENRETTQRLLTGAGLVLYVFSPEKYADEKVWSVLREQQRFSGTAAVLNRVDAGVSAEDVERICRDLRERFAAVGVPDVRIFRTAARRHVGSTESWPESSSGIDETEELRAFLERELQESDVARHIRANRRAVSTHLQAVLDRVAPKSLVEKAALAEQTVRDAAKKSFEPLGKSLTQALSALDDDFAAASALRQHRRFRGPLRAWLATADLFVYGLPGVVATMNGRPSSGEAAVIDRALARLEPAKVDQMLREATRETTSALFRSGLPLARWRSSTTDLSGAKLLREVSDNLQRRMEEQLDASASQRGWVVALGNVLGSLAPAALVIGGLALLGRDLWNGQYVGLPLVGHLLAIAVLFLIVLHGVVGVLLPRGSGVDRAGAQGAVDEVVSAALIDAMRAYRADLEDDVLVIHGPLEKLANPSS